MATEKTDLARILSVSGYPGLFKFVAQSRGGAILESLLTGVRTNFPAGGKMTSLEDIAIYTDEGEMKLREVFEALKKALGDAAAPDAKASEKDLRALFDKAVPTYDGDRFYLSHMKKVASWYNLLKEKATLDFENPDEDTDAQDAGEQ